MASRRAQMLWLKRQQLAQRSFGGCEIAEAVLRLALHLTGLVHRGYRFIQRRKGAVRRHVLG